ncbi:hypothetical protein FPQ18DRAFT_391073 [Pyronema domesticum]|nr:hypothetical protein FPQ18DRAFT_391073 [Pyronema domesticum]
MRSSRRTKKKKEVEEREEEEELEESPTPHVMEDPKISNHDLHSNIAGKKREREEEEERQEDENENEKLKESADSDNNQDEDEEEEDEHSDEEEEDREEEEEEKKEDLATFLVNFHYRSSRFYKVLYNSESDIDSYDLENPRRSIYESLPDCETEEELHTAIYMRQFTMHRLDNDVEVINRYTQWLNTRVEDGELVQNTLEEDIWDIPNWASAPTGEEEDEEEEEDL